MDMDTLRLRTSDGEIFALTCTACGYIGLTLARSDLDRAPLSVVMAHGEHECRTLPMPRPAATPRPAVEHPHLRRFVRDELIVDSKGVETLDSLFARYCDLTGDYPGMGTFARMLRKEMPPGTDIRREMINGIRARRLVGARLRWVD